MRFFNNPDIQKELLTFCKKWEGTPFAYKQMVCQEGTDCPLFIAAILRHFDLLKTNKLPEYPSFLKMRARGGFRLDGYIEEFIKNVHKIGIEYPTSIGNICLFGIKDNMQHIAMQITNDLIAHCVYPTGVAISPYNSIQYKDFLQEVYEIWA